MHSSSLVLTPALLSLRADHPALLLALFGILVLSLSVHEFGHAWTARALGDPTAEKLGRVTLNPIPHLNLIFSVILPLVMIFSGTGYIFGAGKPVPVDLRNLKRPALDMMLISVAGPAMNVVLALLSTGGFHLYCISRDIDPLLVMDRDPWVLIFLSAIRLNFMLAIFNMLPVPPLDGHRVLGFLMPAPIREIFYKMQLLGLVVLVLLLFGGGWAHVYEHVLKPLGELYRPLMPGELLLFF